VTQSADRNLVLASAIRTHHDIGMTSLDESLVDLYQRQIITYETVLAFVVNARK
jgi:Tfp pilus assembly ATPase PilU